MFCSHCGEEFKSRRGLFPASAFCPRCAPRARSARLILAVALLACSAAGFVAGRYSAPINTFHLIGTPVDLRTAPTPEAVSEPPAPAATEAAPQAMCGAPTKSGRPCRRKVRGGGYCWQHRDEKPEARSQKSEARSFR